ncbi:MAG: aspartate aminotransferase [Chloroflexota bacterium]|nr:aspartate aminotransferase [Chloroflexota bacterium]
MTDDRTFNRQFENVVQSPTVAVSDRMLALKAAGREIISLTAGDPDFPTPAGIIEAGVRAMQSGLTHYGPSQGFPHLRAAIAAKLAAPYDPESEILVTHGGVHAYYTALQSILNPGDGVLIPDPSWGTHANMVRLLRGMVQSVPALPQDGFLPKLEAWQAALTPQTRALVINYPSNPTGAVPSRAYMQALLDFAAAQHLWVVSDEVYENLYYGDKPISVAAFPEYRQRVLLVNSLSKTYAMTGWRVGYLAAPAEIIANALKASQNSITCVAPFIQEAAAFALTNADMQRQADGMRAGYARRRGLVLDIYKEFPGSPVAVTPPQGAFYFFLDMRNLGLSSQDIFEQLLDQRGVGLVPGSAFGPGGEGFMRMTIAASDEDVSAGFRAIMEWAQQKGASA